LSGTRERKGKTKSDRW